MNMVFLLLPTRLPACVAVVGYADRAVTRVNRDGRGTNARVHAPIISAATARVLPKRRSGWRVTRSCAARDDRISLARATAAPTSASVFVSRPRGRRDSRAAGAKAAHHRRAGGPIRPCIGQSANRRRPPSAVRRPPPTV
jgi:hypothetical protein